MLHGKLSDLTPQAVDTLYGIDSAQPSDTPTFLFLVGAPGAGKSSGHARAIEAGILQAGNYATINMDTLLESLLPFRAASAMAHFMKRRPATHDLTRFASISAYAPRLLRTSNRVSTPSSERLFRLSSSSNRKTHRRSTVRDE